MGEQRVAAEPVPVLLYHSVTESPGSDAFAVSVDDFRRDMDAVSSTGRVAMTAEQYRQWCASGSGGSMRPVLITFDDGFADYAEHALPVLEEHGLPATLFVTSGWMGRPGMLSHDAVRDLAGGVTEIGAHTVSHPHLDLLTDSEARSELRISREALEDCIGDWVTSLAYPHGSHTRRTTTLARDSGYLTAHAVKNALSHTGDDVFAVARFTVQAETPRSRVMTVLSGRGAPRAWSRERMRTRAFRHVRRLQSGLSVDPADILKLQEG
jgi:peptidoglycan/xylan/chitin deacetylase (PgdA/CDA1 family)